MTDETIQQGYFDHCKVDTNAPEHLRCPAYYTHDGFFQGAQWAEKQIIDKACQYLRDHIDPKLVIYNNESWTSLDTFIEDFRKAMEK